MIYYDNGAYAIPLDDRFAYCVGANDIADFYISFAYFNRRKTSDSKRIFLYIYHKGEWKLQYEITEKDNLHALDSNSIKFAEGWDDFSIQLPEIMKSFGLVKEIDENDYFLTEKFLIESTDLDRDIDYLKETDLD